LILRHASFVLHFIPCIPPMLLQGLNFERARLLWLPQFDRILDALEHPKGLEVVSFIEGNAALELYLQLRPERYEQVEKLCKEGRLRLSCWYITPDFAQHDQEILIRNLGLGMAIANVFGQYPKVAFLSADKNLPPLLPQLLRSAGIEALLLPYTDGALQSQWKSPDGTELWLARYGVTFNDIATPRRKLAQEAMIRHLPLIYPLYGDSVDTVQSTVHNARHTLPTDDVAQSTFDSYLHALRNSREIDVLQPFSPRPYQYKGFSTAFNDLIAAEHNFAEGRESRLSNPQKLILYGWKQNFVRDAEDYALALGSSLRGAPSDDFVRVNNSNFQLTSLKLPDEGSGLIVRGENKTDIAQWVKLSLRRKFKRCDVTNVLEKPSGGALPIDDNGAIYFQAGARRILTFHFHD
jgi:alpha-mannosidase